MNSSPPLAVTYRLFDEANHCWVEVPAKRWWGAMVTGDMWYTQSDMSVRTAVLDPSQFVPPRSFRT